MCGRTFGVDNALWDTLTCEVSKLVKQVEVLHQEGSAWSCSH